MNYKVCSTLDSSPEIGSIGRAIEIGADLFSLQVVPVLVAAPQMRRYQCFGHLFAGMEEAVFRLDQHPVMSSHPVTPIDESDVAKHVSKQSDRLDFPRVNLEALASADGGRRSAKPAVEGRIAAVGLDSADAGSESAVALHRSSAQSSAPLKRH